MNARARIATFFGRSAARGTEQGRALAPAPSPRAKGSGAPARTGAPARSGAPAIGALLVALAAFCALALPAAASAATPPTISNLVVSELTTGSAHFSAEVDPGGAEAEFDTSWHFECVPSCSGLSGGTVSGAPEEVENDATGLQSATFYTVRLVASNTGGERKATATFTTPGASPLVKAWAAGPIAPTTADLNAQIDPRGSSTTYWFEWGTENCAVATCASIPPLHEAFAGSGSTYVYVLRHLTGLSPETTYHFRVVAKNSSGIAEGPDNTFTTAAPEAACTNAGMPGTATLPDCRGYELASPPEKNGNDVIPSTYKVFAAEVGEGVAYSALGGFGDVKGTGIEVQYTSRRDGGPGTSGWSTHSVNPLGHSLGLLPLVFANPPSFQAFSPDLDTAIYRSWSTLDDSPNVAGVANLYRLDDLSGALPQPQLLSASAEPLTAEPFLKIALRNAFDAASKDLSHVIFQSPHDLTGDGSFTGFAGGNLYEYAEGAGLRRVGRVPSGSETECDDSAGSPSPCEAVAGAQAGLSVAMSAGSSVTATGMISDDGARILFTVPSGALYMREGGERTFKLADGGQLWGMSADGSRAFFTTSESLAGDDADGGESDLYTYEVEKPLGQRFTLLSVSATGDPASASRVLGASADGHYIYFVAGGQLVAGEPSVVVQGLYLWHDGAVSYIGQFGDGGIAATNTPASNWETPSTAKASRISPDGRSLLFYSTLDAGFAGRGGYPGYDHGTCTVTACRELYLYSADSGRLTCVSCNPRSAAASSDALTDIFPGASASVPTQHSNHALSDDGRRVFFSTAESLVSEDTNGKWDAYEYDVPTGALHLISSGTDDSDSYFMDASPDGSDAYFVTRERLVGWDVDSSYDLYDARVGGGFPEPAPVPAACEGESCLPAPPRAPGAQPTASQNAGPGNPKAGRCPRGKARRHGRCVKPKKHHKKQQRKANANRRAGR